MTNILYYFIVALLAVSCALSSCGAAVKDTVIDDSKTVTATETDADGQSYELHTYFNKSGQKLSEDKFYTYYQTDGHCFRQIHYSSSGFPEWEQLVDDGYQPISEKYIHEYTYFENGKVESHKNASPYETIKTIDSYSPEGVLLSTKKINYNGSYDVCEYFSNGNMQRLSGYSSSDSLSSVYEWDSNNNSVLIKLFNDDGTVNTWQTQEYYEDGSSLMTELSPDGKPMIAKRFNADSFCTDATIYDENGEFVVRQHYEITEDGKYLITEYDKNGSFVRKYELQG